MKNLKAHHHFAITSLLVFGIVSMWTWGSVVFASDTQITVYIGPPDACKNIPGYQEEIPEGMQVESGNCFSPPAPSPEPCATTACEPPTSPAVDTCQNIDGTQEKIPAGMRRDDEGVCFTPAQIAPSELPPTTSTKEPVKPGLNLPNLWHNGIHIPGDMPLSFLTPQIVIVILTAGIAVSSLVLVRYHHHKASFSSHRRA